MSSLNPPNSSSLSSAPPVRSFTAPRTAPTPTLIPPDKNASKGSCPVITAPIASLVPAVTASVTNVLTASLVITLPTDSPTPAANSPAISPACIDTYDMAAAFKASPISPPSSMASAPSIKGMAHAACPVIMATALSMAFTGSSMIACI